MAMRTEDFTALVDALLPDDDGGTAAFLHAKQAALVALGVRQLLFFLAETTPLRSRLAEEANATSLMELLGKCGLAAEDDLQHVRNPPAPATFRSLERASQPEDSEPQFTALAATEHEGVYISLGATEDSAPQFRSLPEASQLEEVDTSAKRLARRRQRAEAVFKSGSIEALMDLLEKLDEEKAAHAETKQKLAEACDRTQQARAELDRMKKAGVGSGTTARRLLSLIMRAAFKPKGKTKRDIFQPCAMDLEVLQMARDEKGRSIIEDLHEGDLSNFHTKLWPTGPSADELNDSIFHHDTKESSTLPVYEDQQKRAASIASVVQELVDGGIDRPVRVRLLDGHGRMLLSIINEVKKLDLVPEDHLRFQVFEIDEEVKEWHAAVFPSKFVETRNLSVTSPEADTTPEGCEPADILYLNFCSVPTRLSKHKHDGVSPMDQLVSYLNEETGASEPCNKPCNKESVLTFIAKRVQQKTRVMISFFIVTPGQNGQSMDARVDNIPHVTSAYLTDEPTDEMDVAASSSSSTDTERVTAVESVLEQEVRGGSNCGGCQRAFVPPTLLPPTYRSLSHFLACLISVGGQSPEKRCQGPERARAAVLPARPQSLQRLPRIQSP